MQPQEKFLEKEKQSIEHLAVTASGIRDNLIALTTAKGATITKEELFKIEHVQLEDRAFGDLETHAGPGALIDGIINICNEPQGFKKHHIECQTLFDKLSNLDQGSLSAKDFMQKLENFEKSLHRVSRDFDTIQDYLKQIANHPILEPFSKKLPALEQATQQSEKFGTLYTQVKEMRTQIRKARKAENPWQMFKNWLNKTLRISPPITTSYRDVKAHSKHLTDLIKEPDTKPTTPEPTKLSPDKSKRP